MLHCRISALMPLALALGLAVPVRTQGQAAPDAGAQTNPPPAVQQQKPAQVSRLQSTTLPPATPPLTGTLLLTGNLSTLGRPAPSLNERLNLDYALPHGQVFDLRVENYYDGSYNADPPGRLIRNINEHKLEVQGTYTFPLTKVFSLSPALLHHDNFRFSDSYYWAILTLSAKLPLSKSVTLTPNLAAEKRLSGGRLFADFAPPWTTGSRPPGRSRRTTTATKTGGSSTPSRPRRRRRSSRSSASCRTDARSACPSSTISSTTA